MVARFRLGELDDRAREILQLAVSLYIRSGEPIGSRTISKAINRRLSPATIRNIMADLEEAGYLHQPHTSAGRVPSEMGYRFYVDSLGNSPKPVLSAEAYINTRLAAATTTEELMSTACHLLSDISQNVGIVVSAPIKISVLQHIEFVRLDDAKILVILVSQSGLLQQKMIRVGEPYSQEELIRAGNYLGEKFSGHTLVEIRHELVHLMQEERMRFDQQYDKMMRNLIETWSTTLDQEDPSLESVYVHGTGNILSKMDFVDVTRMQDLFRVFEEKSRLVAVLNECLGADSVAGVQIMIGSELGDPCLEGFTVITSPYLQRETATGFMGIIGPTRMEYHKGISVVSYLADACGRMINT
jgi:heat-inducible transcriptional repressor